jgi:hypothetical protein
VVAESEPQVDGLTVQLNPLPPTSFVIVAASAALPPSSALVGGLPLHATAMFGFTVIVAEVAATSGSVTDVATTAVLQAAAGAAGGVYVAEVVGVPAAMLPHAGFVKLHNNPAFCASFVIVAVSATAPWCANSVTALAGAVIATTTASTVYVVTSVWWLLIVDAAVIVAVQFPDSSVGGVHVAVPPFVVSVPQFSATTAGRVVFLLSVGALLLEVKLQTTGSVAPLSSLFSVAVSVTAPAPSPNVVVVPALEVTVTVIALIVSATVVFFVVSLTEVAVIVAVQSAFSVAAAGAV